MASLTRRSECGGLLSPLNPIKTGMSVSIVNDMPYFPWQQPAINESNPSAEPVRSACRYSTVSMRIQALQVPGTF